MVEKMTASERRAAKRREAIEKGERAQGLVKTHEPSINPLNYTASMMRVLNYYNLMYDNKDKRKWTMSYVGKARAKEFEPLADWQFRTVGTLIRLKQRGEPLSEKHEASIDQIIAELSELGKAAVPPKKKEKAEAKVEAPKVDKNLEAARLHAAEIDGLIDDFVMDRREIDLAAYLKANQVPAAVSKLIPSFYEGLKAELAEALEGNCDQLREAYSYLKKTELRKFLKMVESFDEACKTQAIAVKVERKPRVRKEKPASVVAAKVKYMPEAKDLGLKSELPVKMVGASEVWVYNVKYKKLMVYRAEEKITGKGTTLIGWDVKKSSGKTIRKPETVKDYVPMTKRTFAQAYSTLKTKESTLNGRINEDCIILKVFQ